MQPVDLKTALREFFSSYLLEQKQVSPHTLKSYRDTFKLLLEFARSKTGTEQLQLADLTIPLILDFLKHLEDNRIGRGNSAATRNYRLVAIRAFFKYLYAPIIEEGRTQGWFPPPEALREWARKKLGDERLAFVVARAISRRGFRAQPYLGSALESVAPRVEAIFQARISEALGGNG